jgi:hypothetical protein
MELMILMPRVRGPFPGAGIVVVVVVVDVTAFSVEPHDTSRNAMATIL